MKVGDLLFVYGSLRLGEASDLSMWNGAKSARFIGNDTICGKLYDCGWYPGVKEAEDFISSCLVDYVHGEVFEILEERAVGALDGYEGYPSLYDRKQVETKEGRKVWVYTYNPPVSDERRVDSGDWVLYRKGPNDIDVVTGGEMPPPILNSDKGA